MDSFVLEVLICSVYYLHSNVKRLELRFNFHGRYDILFMLI